jgi:Ca2+-binding EF-hand superfamily protein
MTSRRFKRTALALGLVGTLAAIGATQAASAAKQLAAWDSDQDGTIDLAEAKKAAAVRFDSLDSDHDGTLDRKEMARTKVSKARFAAADTDKDGTLDKDEYLTLVEARFKAADADGDGTLSAEELQTKAGKALARLL